MGKAIAFLPLPRVPEVGDRASQPAACLAAVPPSAEPVVEGGRGNPMEARIPHATANATPPAAPNVTPGRLRLPDPEPPWDDPRPDLIGDRARWWVLLQAAYRLDDGTQDNSLFGALVGMRCCGARLEIAGPADWSLQPEGPLPSWRIVRGAEMTEAEYADYRQRYLVPHKAALGKLLSAPAAIAHAPLAPGEAPLTGRGATQSPGPAPRKQGEAPAQPALLEIDRPAELAASAERPDHEN